MPKSVLFELKLKILALAVFFFWAYLIVGSRFYLTWHLKVKNHTFLVKSQVKLKYYYAKICILQLQTSFGSSCVFFSPVKMVGSNFTYLDISKFKTATFQVRSKVKLGHHYAKNLFLVFGTWHFVSSHFYLCQQKWLTWI